MRLVLASRCRRAVRWTAFRSATGGPLRIAAPSATVRAGVARLATRTARVLVTGRAGDLAGQAVRVAAPRARASLRKESRGLVDLGRRIR